MTSDARVLSHDPAPGSVMLTPVWPELGQILQLYLSLSKCPVTPVIQSIATFHYINPRPALGSVLNETERIPFVDPGLSQQATDIMHSSELSTALSLSVTPGGPLVTTFVTSGD